MAVSPISPVEGKTMFPMNNNEEISGIKHYLDLNGLTRFVTLLGHERVDKR